MTKERVSPLKYQKVKDYILELTSTKDTHERIPTESELSQLLGVSSITVRKALSDLVNEGVIYRKRGKGSFVADHEGPANARKSNKVAFVLSGSELFDSSYMQIIKGIQTHLANHKYQLIIEFAENNIEQELEIISKLIHSDIAGLLLYSCDPETVKNHLKEIRKEGLPFVMLDRFPRGVPVSCVACNNHDGAYEGVDYLLQLGHSRIGFIAYDYYLSSEKERYEGYRNALQNANLELNPDLIYTDPQVDYASIVEKINKGDITALFCVNDRRALEVLTQLDAYGIQIPGQVSIIGFDDFDSSKYAQVPLTTVKQHFDALGGEAAKLLLDLIQTSDHGNKKVLLPTSLVLRESTAPLPPHE